MLQLADFVRLAQRTQHIEGGAGPHVGTDAELHPLAPGLLQIEQPAAEEQVEVGQNAIAERVSHRQSHSCSSRCRQWANTLCRRSCHSGGKRPDSFGSAGTVILPRPLPADSRSGASAAKRRGILRAAAAPAPAAPGTGGRKARRNGVTEAAFAVPALDQRTRLAITLLRRFQQPPAHGDPSSPYRRSGACSAFAPEQRIDRLRMHAAEHQRGGGAVAQQLPQKEGRHLVGVLLATVTAFGREGVIV